MKDLSDNFDKLMDEYVHEIYIPDKKPKASLDDSEVEGIQKENKGYTMM